MAAGFYGTVIRWLRSKRPSDKQYVEAARRRQRNSKRLRLIQLVPVGWPIVLLLFMVWWIRYLKQHMDWETEGSTFWLGFCTGAMCGFAFYALVIGFLFTVEEIVGDKRDELLLRFYDELSKKE
jgi:hypothetical protein